MNWRNNLIKKKKKLKLLQAKLVVGYVPSVVGELQG